MEREVNQGYEILSKIQMNDEQGFVLGYNPNASQPYVTWEKDGNVYRSGHYFSNEKNAQIDFAYRLTNKLDVLPELVEKSTDKDTAIKCLVKDELNQLEEALSTEELQDVYTHFTSEISSAINHDTVREFVEDYKDCKENKVESIRFNHISLLDCEAGDFFYLTFYVPAYDSLVDKVKNILGTHENDLMDNVNFYVEYNLITKDVRLLSTCYLNDDYKDMEIPLSKHSKAELVDKVEDIFQNLNYQNPNYLFDSVRDWEGEIIGDNQSNLVFDPNISDLSLQEQLIEKFDAIRTPIQKNGYFVDLYDLDDILSEDDLPYSRDGYQWYLKDSMLFVYNPNGKQGREFFGLSKPLSQESMHQLTNFAQEYHALCKGEKEKSLS